MRINAKIKRLFVFDLDLGGGSSNLLQMARRHSYEQVGLSRLSGMTLPISDSENHRRALAMAVLAPNQGRKKDLIGVLYSTPIFTSDEGTLCLGYWEVGTLEQWNEFARYKLGVQDAMIELQELLVRAAKEAEESVVIGSEEALEMFNERLERQGFVRHVLR